MPDGKTSRILQQVLKLNPSWAQVTHAGIAVEKGLRVVLVASFSPRDGESGTQGRVQAAVGDRDIFGDPI